MKTKSINEIMTLARDAQARGIAPDHPEAGLSKEEQDLWERETRLRWRLAKPLQSIHGERRRRGRGWRSPMARGL